MGWHDGKRGDGLRTSAGALLNEVPLILMIGMMVDGGYGD